MNKLSKRAVDKIMLFLNDKFYSSITLSRREITILFKIYQNATSEISELDNENYNLKQALNEIREVLGKYKHYSLPDEKQNMKNENLVDFSLQIIDKVLGDDKE